jgi:hypothetical protein
MKPPKMPTTPEEIEAGFREGQAQLDRANDMMRLQRRILQDVSGEPIPITPEEYQTLAKAWSDSAAAGQTPPLGGFATLCGRRFQVRRP